MSDPVPALPPVPEIRFCPRCGASWNSGWTQCELCESAARPGQEPQLTSRLQARPVRTALILYFLILLTHIVVFIAIDDELAMELVVEIADTVMVLCFVLANRRFVLGSLRNKGPAEFYGGAVVAALGTFLLSTGLVKVLSYLGIPEIFYLPPFFEHGFGWGLAIVMICVQPAVVEELAFRGIILAAFRRVLNAREAIVVSASIFAIIHLSVPSIPHLFIIGLVLGYFRVRSGSLLPGMVLHFTHNLLCVLTEPWLD